MSTVLNLAGSPISPQGIFRGTNEVIASIQIDSHGFVGQHRRPERPHHRAVPEGVARGTKPPFGRRGVVEIGQWLVGRVGLELGKEGLGHLAKVPRVVGSGQPHCPRPHHPIRLCEPTAVVERDPVVRELPPIEGHLRIKHLLWEEIGPEQPVPQQVVLETPGSRFAIGLPIVRELRLHPCRPPRRRIIPRPSHPVFREVLGRGGVVRSRLCLAFEPEQLSVRSQCNDSLGREVGVVDTRAHKVVSAALVPGVRGRLRQERSPPGEHRPVLLANKVDRAVAALGYRGQDEKHVGRLLHRHVLLLKRQDVPHRVGPKVVRGIRLGVRSGSTCAVVGVLEQRN
eukprot:m.263905 g.263905  ORF g.263905 m.263905 type:complete len:341 (-) comp16017_c0_seq1:1443-2465(-)